MTMTKLPEGKGEPQVAWGSVLSASRYSVDHDAVLGGKGSRNRICIDLASQGKRVLELGCADGFISRHLQERGCQVTAIEIDAQAAERARPWCERVEVYDLNRADWTDRVGRGFDTVLCGDVLEHLARPDLALRQIHKVLPPQGRVIICLPNVAHIRIRLNLLVGRFAYEPTGIMDTTHLRFFTMNTAQKLIEDSGYRILSRTAIVGGGTVTHALRLLFPGLFAVQMIFLATPVEASNL